MMAHSTMEAFECACHMNHAGKNADAPGNKKCFQGLRSVQQTPPLVFFMFFATACVRRSDFTWTVKNKDVELDVKMNPTLSLSHFHECPLLNNFTAIWRNAAEFPRRSHLLRDLTCKYSQIHMTDVRTLAQNTHDVTNPTTKQWLARVNLDSVAQWWVSPRTPTVQRCPNRVGRGWCDNKPRHDRRPRGLFVKKLTCPPSRLSLASPSAWKTSCCTPSVLCTEERAAMRRR